LGMAQGAHDGVPIGAPGHEREVLADLDAGHIGRDGTEGTADVRGSIGLQVPGIKLTRTTDEEELDTGLLAPARRGTELLQSGKFGQAQPDRQTADPEEVSPGEAIAEADAAVPFKAQHGNRPRW